MERVDKTDKSFQFFFGAGCGSKTIIYVAAKKFWFGTIEQSVLPVAASQQSVLQLSVVLPVAVSQQSVLRAFGSPACRRKSTVCITSFRQSCLLPSVNSLYYELSAVLPVAVSQQSVLRAFGSPACFCSPFSSPASCSQ